MARISLHGEELVRVEKAIDTPASDLTTWERMTRAFCRKPGAKRFTILQKHDVRWKPDWLHPKGERYSYGWKLRGKTKDFVTTQQIVEVYQRNGWAIVKGGAS